MQHLATPPGEVTPENEDTFADRVMKLVEDAIDDEKDLGRLKDFDRLAISK